jgi:hypothetical protein
LDRARQILAQGVDEVVGKSPFGGDPQKAAVPDQYRVSILDCLSRLAGRSGLGGRPK